MRKKLQKTVIKAIEIVGYVGLLLQFAWAVILYVSWAVQSGALKAYLDASGNHSQQPLLQIDLPDTVRIPLGIVVTGCFVFLTVYFIRSAPKAATDVTIHVTKQSSSKVTEPTIKKILHSPATRKKMTPTVSLLITKLVISVGLLIMSVISRDIVSLDENLVLYVSIGLWLASLVAIIGHYGLIKLWRLSYHRRH